MLYDPTCVKYQNRQVHRDRTQSLPAAERGCERVCIYVHNEQLFNGYRVSLWADKDVVKLGRSGSCTML